MKWTQEQLEIFAAIGIRPETLCLSMESIPEPGAAKVKEIAPDLLVAEFVALAPFLPKEPRQAGAITNKAVFDALLWAQRSGKKLTQLPARATARWRS